jgi:Protein of unknown function (DUF2934)
MKLASQSSITPERLKETLDKLLAITDEQLEAAMRNEYEKLVAERAYLIFMGRMERGQDGSAEQDWYQAEAEITEAAKAL